MMLERFLLHLNVNETRRQMNLTLLDRGDHEVRWTQHDFLAHARMLEYINK